MITERERVLKAIRHQPTDIIPYHFDVTAEAQNRLIKHFGDPDFFANTGSHLAKAHHKSLLAPNTKRRTDLFKVVWKRESADGSREVANPPLKTAKFGSYLFPSPDQQQIRAECAGLERQRDKFRIFAIDVALFERACSLRSTAGLMEDFVKNQNFTCELFEKIVAYNMAIIDIVADYDIDCVFFRDDWGDCEGLIMGAGIWHESIQPHLQKMYDHAKQYSLAIGQHSSGNIAELFPDLIDMGLDIISSLQPEIYDLADMKRLYGAKLTFYGGISTQKLLSPGTPADIQQQMREIMQMLGRDGGYIAAPSYAMASTTPTANMLAFLEVVQNQNKSR